MKIRFVKETIHGTTHFFTERETAIPDSWQFVSGSLSHDVKDARESFEQIKKTGDIVTREILEQAHAPDPDTADALAWTAD